MPTPSPLEQMDRILTSYCILQAVGVVARLGIADRIANSPQSVSQLALETSVNELALHRLLRMLVAMDIFNQDDTGRIGLAPLGATLRSDAPGSARDRAMYVTSPEMWTVWGQLTKCVETGRSGVEHAHGEEFYSFLSHTPGVANIFDRFMSKTSEVHAQALVDAYDFSRFQNIVDVGGGQGRTLAAILTANPGVSGILFDRPEVLAGLCVIEDPGLIHRAKKVSGDMHVQLPHGADCYLVKWVLADRDDARSIEVLRNCRSAMVDSAKVLVVDIPLPAGRPTEGPSSFDVRMLYINGGGCLREEKAYPALFDAAGLKLSRTIPTKSPNIVIEAVAA